ncbi:MAG TPA: ABC transporter permease subunit [Verrucomicrobiae bacterium]|nr:ABC transporter permease subunit [Verrucomicrobiae bacterium]
MTVLPIVARELRVACRRRATYWMRVGPVLVVLFIGAWAFVMMREEQGPIMAKSLFGMLTGVAMLYGLLAGVRETSDSLSSEKREGTLGFLFLTDLKGYDVVLGKFAASSLRSIYGMLAVVPALGVPLLLGGVTFGEFGRVALAALNGLFLSLSLGMLVSSVSRSARSAAGGTFWLVASISIAGPVAAARLAFLNHGSSTLYHGLLLTSPGYTYYAGWEYLYHRAHTDYWLSLLIVNGVGWVALALASVLARHSWRDRPAGARKVRMRERVQSWMLGDRAERKRFRARLLDRNPFFWLSSRARWRPLMLWLVLCLLGCGWFWGYLKVGRDWLSEPMYLATAIVLNLVMKFWVASEAPRQLAEDRQNGAIELLLATPLTEGEIAKGQLLSLSRQFLGPLILVLAITAVLMRLTLKENSSPETLVFWIGGILMLPADLAAMFFIGLWQGVSARSPRHAASGTLARVMVIPGLAWAVWMFLIGISSLFSRGPGPGFPFVMVSWFIFGLAADLIFSTHARNKWKTEFRTAAASRYSPPRGLWPRIFSTPPAPATS